MRRVLCIGESHASSTGFGGYTKALLTRLYNTKKYDLAQLCIYGIINSPHADDIKWKYYANAVAPQDPRFAQYRENKQWTFGGWRFNEVLLDFKPDIVIDFRDPFMFDFEWISPLRPYFYWIIAPTVDSAPQQDDWLNMFSTADAILTYSEFGKKVLEKELKIIPIADYAYPGADLETFRPLNNKDIIKKSLLLPNNSYIIGTVMRNQIRKLYPDFLKAFNIFLEKADPEISKNTFLYFHTSFPDMGWNLDNLLNTTGLGHKIFFTYVCINCKHIFSSLFQGAATSCPKCKKPGQCVLPNAEHGVPTQNLNQIYNTFDLYIQYANCEGAGMPSIEAGAAGIPIATVDYSAMSDIVRLLDGFPMKPRGMFHSLNMGADRSYPDNELLADIIINWLNIPSSIRKIKGQKTRKLTEKHFNWDDNAKKWEHVIDNAVLTNRQGRWDAPLSLPTVNAPTLINGTIKQQVYWVIDNIIGRPELKYTLFATKLINNIEQKVVSMHGSFAHFSLEKLQALANDFFQARTKYEKIRCGLDKMVDYDYLQYANLKQQIQQ